MPKNLGEIAPTPAEDIKIAGMGIALQTLLNRQSQALHAAAHVRVPSGDPDPDTARYRDHRRLRTSRTRPKASASTFSSTLTRLPSPSSISIRPRRFRAGIAVGASIDPTLSAAAAVTRTGTRRGPPEATVARRARRRHVNTKLVARPCRRALSVTTAPGAVSIRRRPMLVTIADRNASAALDFPCAS